MNFPDSHHPKSRPKSTTAADSAAGVPQRPLRAHSETIAKSSITDFDDQTDRRDESESATPREQLDDIQFGEVSEPQPVRHRRPDDNSQHAVVSIGETQEDDLPIFVSLDAMRDMESHALTNTSVELGGVMLGGQHIDRDGKPFVIIEDSLRAEHFEATRGSFKFTHQTWEAISRQRATLPENLQMVGWYHTHPDWGVFLSGMDLFICQNFFARPLDVALVIDPVRHKRGWFFWPNFDRGSDSASFDSSDEPPRDVSRGSSWKQVAAKWSGAVRSHSTPNPAQAAGFYLYAHRHRATELNRFAELLNSENQPGGVSLSTEAGVATMTNVIHLHDQRTPIHWPVFIALLVSQLLLLALVLIVVLRPPVERGIMAAAEHAAADSENAREAQQQLATYREILSHMLTAQGNSPDLADSLAQEKQQHARTQRDLATYVSQTEYLTSERQQAHAEIRRLNGQVTALQGQVEQLGRVNREIVARQNELRSAAEQGQPLPEWLTNWPILVAALMFTMIIGGVLGFFLGQHRSDPQRTTPSRLGRNRSGDDDQFIE